MPAPTAVPSANGSDAAAPPRAPTPAARRSAAPAPPAPRRRRRAIAARAAAPPPRRAGEPRGPRPSRLGGAILIAGAAALAIVLAIVLIGGDGDDGRARASTSAAQTQAQRAATQTSTTAANGQTRGENRRRRGPQTDRGRRQRARRRARPADRERQTPDRGRGGETAGNGAQDIYAIWLQGTARRQLPRLRAQTGESERHLHRQLAAAERTRPVGLRDRARHDARASTAVPTTPGRDGPQRPAQTGGLSAPSRSSARERLGELSARRALEQERREPRPAEQPLAQLDRHASSRAPPSAGASSTAVTASASSRSNGVPSSSCSQRSSRGASRLQHAEVRAHASASRGPEHLREAPVLDRLHPHDARPPARLVPGIGDHGPDGLGRGRERAADARRRHAQLRHALSARLSPRCCAGRGSAAGA